jgi:hypothetical protein
MMIPLIDYLFFRIYKFTLKTPSAHYAVLSTSGSITILLFINMLTINKYIFKTDFFEVLLSFKKDYVMIFILFIMYSIYLLFKLNRRYLRIYEYFSKESLKQDQIRGGMVIGYIVLTFVLFLVPKFIHDFYFSN